MTTSVITGDIVKSTAHKFPKIWLDALKEALSFLATNRFSWRLHQGDSFQLEIPEKDLSFISAVYIKASMKSKRLDVRLAIGVGDKSYEGENVSESNGEAFMFSGETLETLTKEKQNLRIKTNDSELDEELNLYFKLALIAMDSWTVNTAEIVKLTIEHPNALQSELGKMIGINQNAVSTRQKRAHLNEIMELDSMYRKKIGEL